MILRGAPVLLLVFSLFTLRVSPQNPPRLTVDSTFRVVVNCDASLKKMIKVGRYNWVHPGINNKRFPVACRDTQNVDVHLVRFDREMEFNEILSELDRAGFRPASLAELLALGALYPEEQKRSPIFALGSVWQVSYREQGWEITTGDYCAPRLGGDTLKSGWRDLDLNLFRPGSTMGTRWKLNSRFAAVPK